jgi:DNA-directed RNA polymerase specialized sigma24 family protein
METKQANQAISRNLRAIERAVAQVVSNHWMVAQSPAMRADTVADVVQGAVIHLISYSLPRFDASKATKTGDAAVDQFVKSAAANYARNWRKAHGNRPTDSVDTIGITGDDGDKAPGRQVSALDPSAPAGQAVASAGQSAPEAFASLARKQDHAKLLAAIERVSGLDRELLDGLVAGEAKQDIAKRLNRSPAWVTVRLKALRPMLAGA